MVDPLLNMSEQEGQLMPFRSTTLELVYGDMEYIRSVFGPAEITRGMLSDYYDTARATWQKCAIPKGYHRGTVTNWCKSVGIRPLHYYAPMGEKTIWFKNTLDVFAFNLKFGY